MKMRRLMSPRSPSTRRPISASIWLSPQPLRHSRESGIPAPRALPAAPDPRFRGMTVTPTSIFVRTSRIGGDVGPVICRHQLRPAAVKPPLVAGPNTRAPITRSAFLTSGGAALSTKIHAQTSVLSGPRGCHTRIVRDVGRRIEKFGNTVPANRFSEPQPFAKPVLNLGRDLFFVGQDLRRRRVGRHIGSDRHDAVTVAE